MIRAGPRRWTGRAGAITPNCRSPCPSPPPPGGVFWARRKCRRRCWTPLIDLTRQNDLSSLHITFCTADEAEALAGRDDTLHRVTQQFHWENRGYSDFSAFLADLSSRKRKMIRREREIAQSQGLTIRALTGNAIEPAALGRDVGVLSGHRQPQMGHAPT